MGRKKNIELGANAEDNLLKLLEPVEEEEETKEEKEEKEVEPEYPEIGTFEWTSFVLSKLNPDELWNGCPTYEGLRRICYDLLGTIVDIDIDVRQTPNAQNGNHSCIVAKILIEHPLGFRWLKDISGKTIRYSHVGDSFHGNGNNDPFAWRFSSATCCTRVKASLLRDAFRLKYVYTKEEMSDIQEDESGANGYINPNQIDALDMMCSRINVDAAKFIRGVWKKARANDDTTDLNKVPFAVAINCIAYLQPWQRDLKLIKPEVIGYDAKWKNSFKE